jgi:hypothetical protein
LGRLRRFSFESVLKSCWRSFQNLAMDSSSPGSTSEGWRCFTPDLAICCGSIFAYPWWRVPVHVCWLGAGGIRLPCIVAVAVGVTWVIRSRMYFVPAVSFGGCLRSGGRSELVQDDLSSDLCMFCRSFVEIMCVPEFDTNSPRLCIPSLWRGCMSCGPAC